ncbi:MAG: ABC transporter ATP-binding protein [Paraclostridium sp.]|uniref:ABC transporter ATP-binding protein n=1 Tax=Paraclostridium sp. TaxID=2023273 RepID=UPI003F315326
MILSIENLNKHYEDKVIYKDFNVDFNKNKVNCIIGKSGCGKSTLLNLITGISESDDEKFNILPKSEVSYVFQEDRLIEWLTLEENMKLVGMKFYDKEELNLVVNRYLSLVEIEKYKNVYPQMLSGGIRQRANIARAFIKPSNYIIMDEPFKSIDVKIKNEIMIKLKSIFNIELKTVVFVTHDIEEALFLADKIFILGERPVQIKRTFENLKEVIKEDIIKFI